MSYPESPLANAFSLATTSEPTISDQRYSITGIYSFGKGLIRRPDINGFETSYSTLSRISAGQVVMSKLNAWEGAIALVDEPFDGTYVSSEYPVFEINKSEHDTRYLSYLITWPELWRRLTPRGSMVRRKRTTPATFLATTVPLPDIGEQRRVSSILDTAMSKLTRTSTLRNSAQISYEALRESLIADISNSTARAVGSIMELKRRAVRVEPDLLYREIGLRSFGKGVFHKAPVTGESLGEKKIFSIEPGDLLFSSVFAWEGALARASEAEEGRVGSHRFMTYVVDDTVADADYLRFFFLSASGLKILRQCSPGGAGRNKTLGIKAFQATQILLPPLREQQHIARILLTAEKISQRLNSEYERRAEKCRLSLLNAAFMGKL